MDIWKTVWGMARGARERGARILPYHKVVEVHRSDGEVDGVRVVDTRSGDSVDIEAGVTVSATGAWAGQLAEMAGIEGVHVMPGRGIMIAMNHRIVNTVVNRCQMPTDGDIIVPIRTVSVIGTTDQHVEDPDDHSIGQDEVDAMLEDGERLVPGFKDSRALRVWSGARPLFEDKKDDVASTRDITRAHSILDHKQRDGVSRFFTITGGKATTFRLMAEDTMDAVCKQLGEDRPCLTRTTQMPGSEPLHYYRPSNRLAQKEEHLLDAQLVCECELVSRGRLEEAFRQRGTSELDDIRRYLRLGMGPCQGGFCIYRATGILHGMGGIDAEGANGSLLRFVQERWKGVWPILYGDQLRQARLDEWIFQGVLDVEHL